MGKAGLKAGLKILAVGVLLFAAGGGVMALTYQNGLWRFNNPGLSGDMVRGIDVSRHQGAIAWDEIPKDRFSFVYIKATEGGDFTDPRFTFNRDGALRNGFKTGAYHFFTLCRDGKDQARNFIRIAGDLEGGLPPAIDLEFTGNCMARPSRDDFNREFLAFIRDIESHYRVSAVLYTTRAFYRAYLGGGPFVRNPLWMRDVLGRPEGGWLIWQYADNIRVPGIAGNVDANVMNIEQ